MNKGKKLYGAWVKVPLEDGGSKEAIFHFYADPEDAKLLSCWRDA